MLKQIFLLPNGNVGLGAILLGSACLSYMCKI